MIRRCIVCDKNLNIILNKNGTYKGGYYFGKINSHIGKGKYIKVGTTKLAGKKVDVVKWNGKSKKVEY